MSHVEAQLRSTKAFHEHHHTYSDRTFFPDESKPPFTHYLVHPNCETAQTWLRWLGPKVSCLLGFWLGSKYTPEAAGPDTKTRQVLALEHTEVLGEVPPVCGRMIRGGHDGHDLDCWTLIATTQPTMVLLYRDCGLLTLTRILSAAILCCGKAFRRSRFSHSHKSRLRCPNDLLSYLRSAYYCAVTTASCLVGRQPVCRACAAGASAATACRHILHWEEYHAA